MWRVLGVCATAQREARGQRRASPLSWQRCHAWVGGCQWRRTAAKRTKPVDPVVSLRNHCVSTSPATDRCEDRQSCPPFLCLHAGRTRLRPRAPSIACTLSPRRSHPCRATSATHSPWSRASSVPNADVLSSSALGDTPPIHYWCYIVVIVYSNKTS